MIGARVTGPSGCKLAIVLVSIFLVAASPQQKPLVIPGLGETIEVSLINVDVVVTDRHGQRIRGLTKNDFEIYENGRSQPISNFAEYGQAAVEDDSAAVTARVALDVPEPKRTVVLFLEPFKLQDFRVNPFVDALKNLVRTTIRKGDAVSMIEFDRRFRMVVAPTDDVTAIELALDEFGRKCQGVLYDPAVTVAAQSNAARSFEAQSAAFGASRGLTRAPMSDADIGVMEAKLHAMQARLQMNQRVAAINSVIQSMAGTDGRKMLILSPHRLGRYSGADFFYAAGFSFMPPDMAQEFDNLPAIESIARNANAAGVTIYPVYAPGIDEVSADPDAPDIARQVMGNEMAGFTELAASTGGIAEWGTANIAKGMPAVAADASAYYSLAYRATTHRADAVRKVVVRTKNPALKVRARSEFVEKSDDARMRDRILSALYVEPTASSFPIDVQVGNAKRQGTKQLVPLSIRVPVASLSAVPEGHKHRGAFSVYVVSGADNGDVSDIVRQTQVFELTEKQLAKAKEGYFTYTVEALVRGSSARFGVGVLDEISKSYGLARVPITR